MKIKQPQHCAHVAAYYVEKASMLGSFIHQCVFGWTAHDGSEVPPDHDLGLFCLKRSEKYFVKAVKEFNRAGGRAI